MHRRLLLLALVAACGQKPKAKAPTEDKPPELDIVEPWVDPADDLPKGIARTAADREAALHNDNATPIIIRGAKIMTAAGQILDSGTIVLEGGAITYVGDEAGAPSPDGATVIDGKDK